MDTHTDHLGQLDQVDGAWRLTFVRSLSHPPEKVWRAITEAEHLTAWFPTSIEGERAAGAKLLFRFPEDEAPAIDGEMTVWDPPSVLEFLWGDERMRFELRPEGGGSATVLTLLNTFDERGKGARDAAGWHACLDALQNHLVGGEPPFDQEKRWADVHPVYVERFGPEASTIGPPDWKR